jgi:cytochrome P450
MPKTAPGPKTSWIPFKGLFAFQRDPVATLKKLATYGDLARMRLALSVFLVSDPELIRQLFLPLNDSMTKGRALERAKILLGEGLLTSEGAHHARQRRLIMPAFHRGRIALYGGVMAELACRMRESWSEGQEIDLRGEMMRLTLDIAGRTMFGAKLESEASAISQALNEVMDRFQLAMLPGTLWMRHLPTPGNLRLKRAMKRLDAVVFGMIAQARQEEKLRPQGRDDLLAMLLQAQDEEDNNAFMSDTQVRDEVMTLFLAGHETTANALTWTWVQMARNPSIFERLRAEVHEVLGDRLPKASDLQALKYTEMVFAESMRLYPPAWIVGRRATEDMELGGYAIPKGSILVMSQLLTHRDPRFWKDPESFDPQRFSAEEKAKRPHFAYFPFGAGPRGCIGEGFAWMEGILVLATLAQRWRLDVAPEQSIEASPQFTLRPKGRILAKVV